MKRLILLFTLSLLIFGCAFSVHQVHVSDFEPYAAIESGKVVQASGEQFVVLSFTRDTDYVNQAYEKLQRTCPDGMITGITTQHSTSLGFFSWTNKVLLQGLCVK